MITFEEKPAKPRVTPERVTEIRESVTKLSVTKLPVIKRHGRPPKAACAMTAAQKQRAYRERAKAKSGGLT